MQICLLKLVFIGSIRKVSSQNLKIEKKTQISKIRRITENGNKSPKNFDPEVRITNLKKALIPVLKFPCSEKSSIWVKFHKGA